MISLICEKILTKYFKIGTFFFPPLCNYVLLSYSLLADIWKFLRDYNETVLFMKPKQFQ